MKRRGGYLDGTWIPAMRYTLKYLFSRRGMGASFFSMTGAEGNMAKKLEVAKKLARDDILMDFGVPASIVIYSARKKKGG